jgi:5-methylcytosine-specific restriction protein A
VTAITEGQVQTAYSLAKEVYRGARTETQAVSELQAVGMNRSSATDYIRNFKQMMLGENYQRTLNTSATEYYLEHILRDFGAAAAVRALTAVRKHTEYYEGLGHGRLLGVSAFCDIFESRLVRAGDLPDADDNFDAAVDASLRLAPAERSRASLRFPKMPRKTSISIVAFVRNPHVVASVLERANGRCEGCGELAPFTRKTTGTPYLEVHHKITLASGGEDTVENAIGLCPNCHRRAHYG